MLKQKTNKICWSIIIGNISFYIISAVLLAMYIVSDYIPFSLLSIVVGLFAFLITLQMLFKKPIAQKIGEPKPLSQKRFVMILQKVSGFFVMLFKKTVKFYNKYRVVIKLGVTLVMFLLFHSNFIKVLKYITTPVVLLWQPIVVVVLFVLTIIVDKICLHTEPETEFDAALNKNIRIFVKFIYFLLALVIVASSLLALNIFNAEIILKWIIVAVFYYVSVFVLVSYINFAVRKKLDISPQLIIPVPFVKNDKDSVSLLDYLEQNTGVSMRGMWSMRFIKQIAPVTVFLVAVLLWLSTCIVQIDSDSEGVIYRLGVLQKETLTPGLHLVLPYPVDKVEVYNTKKVNTVTIGYSSEKTGDNLWTGSHGNTEYKLLLGSGDELVSINLRLEYKINDTLKYLTTTSAPVDFLKAQAYDLVTDMTINTNLTEVLSIDRDAFSKSFEKKLSKTLKSYDLGIELVSVVLESIHPPLEVSGIFQSTVSALIEAEQIITEAERIAEEIVVEAEQTKNIDVASAKKDYYTKLAAAKTEVAEFMAGVEAYNAYSSEYKYYKYLSAISKAYNNSNLVIVGKGIDSSRLYFGNFVTSGSKE